MKLRTRLVSLLAAGSLCALTLVASPAQATVSPSATAAGKWLAGELTDGLIHNDGDFPFDDYGLTLDVLMALQEADTQGPKQNAIVSAMNRDIKKYVFNDQKTAKGGVWAGSAAKSLVAIQAAGKDPKSFGGVDLVSLVENAVQPSGSDSGRIKDQGIPGYPDPSVLADYSNLLYQAYGLQGLAKSGSKKVDNVKKFFLKQQCAQGYFRLNFDECKPDTDATAIAIRSMSAAKSEGVTGLDRALAKATKWLVKEQHSDGSFGGGDSTAAPNTNSTGLAASALALRGNTKAAQEAAAWVYKFQVKASTGGKLAKETGAVALNSEGLSAGKTNGITNMTSDQWRRATAQAAVGLIHLDPNTIDTKTKTKSKTKIVIKEVRSKPLVRNNTSKTAVTVTEPDTKVTSEQEATSKVGKLGQYLAGQLSRGDHLEVKAGDETYVDYDLTADAALALRQIGQQQKIAERTTQFLFDKNSIDAYVHGAPYEKDASYAEPLAKLLIVGHLAKDVDAKTLQKMADELAGLQTKDGSFEDKGENADRSGGTEREALAMMALQMSEKSAAVKRAGTFFENSQCDDGGFAPILGVACKNGEAAATGWALQALSAGSSSDLSEDSTLAEAAKSSKGTTAAAAAKAVESLQSVVHLDGSVDDGDGDASVHDTAIVAEGLQAAGLDTHRTARFLGSAQQEDGGIASTIGGKKSNMTASIVSAPAMAATSLATTSNVGLPAVLLSSSNPQMTVAKQSGNHEQTDGIVISRSVAYIGGAVLAALVLAALAMAAIAYGRKGTRA